jgi:hypothetical protein
MDFPLELRSAISQALAAMTHDPHYDLAPGYQLAILKALGPSPRHQEAGSIWGKRCVVLAIDSVDKVIPRWDRQYPSIRNPHTILREAQRVFSLDWDYHNAMQIAYYNYWDHFQGVDQNNAISFILNAALAALGMAITAATTTDAFYPRNIDYSVTNDSVSLEQQSPWFLASVANAGGTSWGARSNNTLRREYWEWWLEEAVVKAYSAVP